MPAISKVFVTIADGAVDPDSPVDATLLTGFRDSLIHLREWLGASFFAGAVQDHDHDGLNSASIPVGPNALRNGSFEGGESGWTFTNFSGGSHAGSSSNHADGAKSMEFVSTVLANGGGEAVANEYRSCGNNEPIPLSFWVWASVAGVSSRVEIIWYDNAKAQISATTVRLHTSTPTAARFNSEVVRAPTNARWFRMRITGGVPGQGSATGTVRFDGIRISAAQPHALAAEVPLNIFKAGALNMAQATTNYMAALGRAVDTEALAEVYVIKPFTMKELRAHASAAVPAGNTAVFTLRKNGADTALTCTIGAEAASADDLVNSVSFSLGDRYAIKVVTSATAGTNDYTATLRQNKLDQEVGLPILQLAGSLGAGGNLGEWYVNVAAVNGTNGYQLRVPKCTASVWLPSFVTTNTAPPFVYRNGVVVPALDSEVAADVARDAQHYYPFDEMDALTVKSIGAWTGRGVVYLQSRDETKHDPCLLAFSSINQAQATTVYMGAYIQGVFSTTEAEVQIRVPAGRYRNLRAELDAVPASGQTMSITVRKNGVDTALTCQITNAGGLTATDLNNEEIFAAGDRLSVKSVSSATLGTRVLSITMEPFA